ASDVDDTGGALEALAGSGDSGTVGRAVGFLRSQQNGDGGFPASPGQDSNAQSTAWAVQGLLAVGVDPGSWHRGGAASPEQYLQSLIAADGHIAYSRSSDQTPVWVTAQAMMALAGKPLPISGPAGGSSQAAGASGHGQHGGGSHQRAGRGRGSRHGRAGRSLSLSDRLAGDMGTFMALMLAPVGAS